MDDIKRMLVVLDASPRSAVRLRLARALSHRHGGEVTALYGVLPTLLATPWAAGEGVGSAASLLAEVDDQQRRRARAVFQDAGDPERLHWLDGGDAPYRAMLHQCFTHDLLVLGQPGVGDAQTGALPTDLVPAAITDGGRPTLVVPAVGAFDSTDGPVLVAWKPTREAARAVSAALPWLRRAPQVHLASQEESVGAEPALETVEHWLRMQGVRAPIHRHGLAAGEVGERLLSAAADVGAALLVMGCYGHGRAREWMLGGATRTVLRTMTLPVLMAH
jgi:nucleotide-binding universal stress UspA family protein